MTAGIDYCVESTEVKKARDREEEDHDGDEADFEPTQSRKRPKI